MAVEEILDTHLNSREDILGTEWRLWEHKTLNLHRGVLRWRAADRIASLPQMSESVREQVESRFRVAWWRGFAFGTLIEAETIPPDLPTIEDWIDTRANRQGTWQWAIYSCAPHRVAIGVHTWTEGFLSPVYRDLLDCYRSRDYEVGSFRKEKDRLMKFLTTVASLKGYRFKEFKA